MVWIGGLAEGEGESGGEKGRVQVEDEAVDGEVTLVACVGLVGEDGVGEEGGVEVGGEVGVGHCGVFSEAVHGVTRRAGFDNGLGVPSS